MPSISEIQDEVVDEFALFDDWQDRYAHIIDLGRDLDPIDPAWKTDENKVRGCQSQVWLHAEPRDGVLHLEAESDALIVQGLIALVLRIYSDQAPRDILDTPPDFLGRIGLDRHLSTSRNNGLQAMLGVIRGHAEAMV